MTTREFLKFLINALTAPNSAPSRFDFERDNPGGYYTHTMRRAYKRELSYRCSRYRGDDKKDKKEKAEAGGSGKLPWWRRTLRAVGRAFVAMLLGIAIFLAALFVASLCA